MMFYSAGVLAAIGMFLVILGLTGVETSILHSRVRSRLSDQAFVSSRRPLFPHMHMRFWPFVITTSAVTGLMAVVVDGVGLCLLVVFAVVFVALVVRNRRRRLHRQMYDRHLLQVLDATVLSLRSGAGLVHGLREASMTGDGPVERDIREVMRQVDLGVRFEDALATWSNRCQERSVRLVVACIALAHNTGGSNARSIGIARVTVRNALVAEASMQTYAAQSRASSGVLAALPIVISGPMVVFNETARAFLLHSPIGLSLLATGLVLDVVGVLWMSALIERAQS